jgi:diguanylate cyclase (GGDEF)-like protein
VKVRSAPGGSSPALPPRRRRSPRLVLRFALVTALVLGVGAAAILVVVRGLVTTEAEDSGIARATLVADSTLKPELRPSDLRGPVAGKRRAQLDRLLLQRVLLDGTKQVDVVRRDGLVTYSTDHRLIGKRLSRSEIGASARGSAISTVVGSSGPGAAPGKVLQTFAPLPLTKGAKPAVAIVSEDYSVIEAEAGKVFFPVAAVLESVLVLLFVLLLPVLRRVSIRIERQMEEIERAANVDDLTELPNRRLFRDLIGDALAAAGPSRDGPAVLLLDVDNFRDVNDTLGHQSGDVVLRALRSRLGEVLDGSATLARLGGDEFGILLPLATRSEAIGVGERVLASLEAPIFVAEIPLAIEASIGIVCAPSDGGDVDTLLRRADIAMYSAKELRAGYALYDPTVDTLTADRLALVAELRQALAVGHLSVVYQPKARLATGEVTGVEALVSWDHPVRGPVAPAEFVPVAERTGLIRALTRYVLTAAVRQCRAWADAGLELSVAVNVSAADVVNEQLESEVATLLQAEGVRPELIALEVTESAVMADPATARRVLLGLRNMGVRLSIDDYGTGHASLAYLKALPVHELKIDQSFVANMTTNASDATIVRSTIALARNLGLSVVAEGVETVEAFEELREFGCTEAQGFAVGRPMPPDRLAEWLGSLPAGAPPPDESVDEPAAPAFASNGALAAAPVGGQA